MLLDLLVVAALSHPSILTTATVHSHREPLPAALCDSPILTRPAMRLNARLRLAVLLHDLSPPAI
jgi:hypothetical protein